MKLRTLKKTIPKDFRKKMYESYKFSMKLYGKPIQPYKEWIREVMNIKL
ncbi:hypothetical protein ACGE0T_14180 [Parabacteroides sp. APC149_11_2_Y6]